MMLYAVIRADGTPKRTRCGGALAVYAGMSVAKRNARIKGDYVVTLDLDVKKTPIHIHARKVDPNGVAE